MSAPELLAIGRLSPDLARYLQRLEGKLQAAISSSSAMAASVEIYGPFYSAGEQLWMNAVVALDNEQLSFLSTGKPWQGDGAIGAIVAGAGNQWSFQTKGHAQVKYKDDTWKLLKIGDRVFGCSVPGCVTKGYPGSGIVYPIGWVCQRPQSIRIDIELETGMPIRQDTIQTGA